MPALQQGLTADQKDTRLCFAQRYLNFDWSDVIFTDEKVFKDEVYTKNHSTGDKMSDFVK
jgi:hypothetical protein